jgi:hypothetical protein
LSSISANGQLPKVHIAASRGALQPSIVAATVRGQTDAEVGTGRL